MSGPKVLYVSPDVPQLLSLGSGDFPPRRAPVANSPGKGHDATPGARRWVGSDRLAPTETNGATRGWPQIGSDSVRYPSKRFRAPSGRKRARSTS